MSEQPTGNGAAAGTQGKPEALEARLEAAERERDRLDTLARQVQADFENYQKRQQRDLATERRYAQMPLAADLLPALDNLDRALAAARQAKDNGPLATGVAMVQGQLLDVLRRHGVTRIEAQGQPFDPNRHQAVTQVPTADQPPQTVVNVFEQGYLFHDRVLRPARVAVAVPVSQDKANDPNQGGRGA
jgi:molecular chaperone GrpE